MKNQKQKTCVYCGEQISAKALRCKYCRMDQPKPRLGILSRILRKLRGV